MDDGNHDGLAGYWDPLPTARRLLAEQPHLDHFDGLWEERNWRNAPGPFYGADTDSMQMGRHDAPFHIGYGDDHGPLDGMEFVYRQPADPAQTYDLLNGCFFGHGGFAMDGDDHWTVPTVREWWQERRRVRAWAVDVSDRWSSVAGEYHEHYRAAGQGLRDYIAYLDHGLEEYLRGYLFWLAERRPPRAEEALPLLGQPRRGMPVPSKGGAAAAGTAQVAPAPDGAELLLAGYFVAVPEPVTGSGLPRAERLTTASDCLIDRLPQDGCWFDTAQEARTACGPLQGLGLASLTAAVERLGGFDAQYAQIERISAHHGDDWEVLLHGHLKADRPVMFDLTDVTERKPPASSPSRATVLVPLAQDLPPAVLASLLGLHAVTAEQWWPRTATDWTAYLGARSTSRAPGDDATGP